MPPLPPPGGPTGGGWIPPPPPDGDAQDLPSPWEERGRRGTLQAFADTVRLSMFEPSAFFSRMRVNDSKGAVSYFWIVWAISSIGSLLWEAALRGLQGRLMQSLPQNEFLSTWMSQRSLQAGSVIGALLMGPVVLFLLAGVVHLFAMLFKCSSRGFDATLRAMAYSSAPMMLGLLPVCGGTIGAIWWSVLSIIALAKLQRASTGSAAAALLAPGALLLCCCCAIGTFAAMAMGFGAAALMTPQ